MIEFFKKNKVLIHLDLSCNNFSLAESKLISEALKVFKNINSLIKPFMGFILVGIMEV